MRFREILLMAIGSLGANKLRSILTMLGITIGVFSVVGVMTALEAVKESINSGLNVMGAGVFSVQRMPAIQTHSTWWKYRNRPIITWRQAEQFQKLMAEYTERICVKISNDFASKVSYQDRETAPRMGIVGTNEFFIFTNNHKLNYGRNLTSEDIEFARPVVVINSAVERVLFPQENPLDKMITVGKFRYRVVGVLEEKGKILGDDQDRLMLIPITRFFGEYGQGNRWQSISIQVQAKSLAEFAQTQDAATGAFRSARGLDAEDENNFELVTNDSLIEAFDKVAVIVQIAGFIISIIALITAGVGIMNIMLVSVTERTREIGVRKSIGARSRDILKQFLLEAIFLSELGALGGILLGAGVGNIAAKLLNADMIFPWFWAIFAIVICSGVGIVFGIYPAWKASRLHPVEALRYE
ncbi:MAG: ABC transporter permease [Verrucomicrobiota bacterium]|nr:ABC transporter permease [Verrucomicrobiota bacterium]